MAYEIPFSSTNFIFLRDLAREFAGIELSDNKKWMIYSRVSHLLYALNIKTFDEYCNLLKQGNKEYLRTFIHAVTTHETQFFREEHHFDYLKNTYFPNHLSEIKEGKKLQILSAGCSTGEEAYSIAVCALESMLPEDIDLFILAVDIDSYVLELADKGIYTAESSKKINRDRLNKYFLKGTGSKKNYVKVKHNLRRLIAFRELNLASKWAFRDKFDIVFCRNVILYFTKEVKERVIERFHQYLKPSGLLILGYSEHMDDFEHEFRLIGNSVYEKIDGSQALKKRVGDEL